MHCTQLFIGRRSDGGVFKESSLLGLVANIPEEFHFIGDSGFALLVNLMTPYTRVSKMHENVIQLDYVLRKIVISGTFDRLSSERDQG